MILTFTAGRERRIELFMKRGMATDFPGRSVHTCSESFPALLFMFSFLYSRCSRLVLFLRSMPLSKQIRKLSKADHALFKGSLSFGIAVPRQHLKPHQDRMEKRRVSYRSIFHSVASAIDLHNYWNRRNSFPVAFQALFPTFPPVYQVGCLRNSWTDITFVFVYAVSLENQNHVFAFVFGVPVCRLSIVYPFFRLGSLENLNFSTLLVSISKRNLTITRSLSLSRVKRMVKRTLLCPKAQNLSS